MHTDRVQTSKNFVICGLGGGDVILAAGLTTYI